MKLPLSVVPYSAGNSGGANPTVLVGAQVVDNNGTVITTFMTWDSTRIVAQVEAAHELIKLFTEMTGLLDAAFETVDACGGDGEDGGWDFTRCPTTVAEQKAEREGRVMQRDADRILGPAARAGEAVDKIFSPSPYDGGAVRKGRGKP